MSRASLQFSGHTVRLNKLKAIPRSKLPEPGMQDSKESYQTDLRDFFLTS